MPEKYESIVRMQSKRAELMQKRATAGSVILVMGSLGVFSYFLYKLYTMQP